jgi:hypothetical protein
VDRWWERARRAVAGANAFKIGLAVLIGLASVCGALLAWHLADVADRASAADGTSTREELTLARDRSQATVVASTEATAHARYESTVDAAEALRALADDAEADGRADYATSLRGEAQLLEESAAVLYARFDSLTPDAYVDEEDRTFDIEARRDDLMVRYARDRSELEPRPDVSSQVAEEERDQTLDLGIAVLLVGVAVFLMTIGELLKGPLAYLGGAGGVACLAVAMVLSVVHW